MLQDKDAVPLCDDGVNDEDSNRAIGQTVVCLENGGEDWTLVQREKCFAEVQTFYAAISPVK